MFSTGMEAKTLERYSEGYRGSQVIPMDQPIVSAQQDDVSECLM